MKTPFAGGGRGIPGARIEAHDKVAREIEDYQYADGDESFETDLVEELKSSPYLKVHAPDIRAMRAFRNGIPSIKNADPENLNVYLINPERNVAITRALRKGDSTPTFTVLTETGAEARTLRRKSGIEKVFKGDPRRRILSEPVDIVVVMRGDAAPTRRTLRNVRRGGWFLVPVERANVARTEGLIFMGVIDRSGAFPNVRRGEKDYWEKKEVESDEEFQHAKEEDGVVTYAEAKAAVKKAYGSSRNNLQSYRRLIKEAKKQNPSWAEDGAKELTCRIERGGELHEVSVKIILPLKDIEHSENDLAIFRKKLGV